MICFFFLFIENKNNLSVSKEVNYIQDIHIVIWMIVSQVNSLWGTFMDMNC